MSNDRKKKSLDEQLNLAFSASEKSHEGDYKRYAENPEDDDVVASAPDEMDHKQLGAAYKQTEAESKKAYQNPYGNIQMNKSTQSSSGGMENRGYQQTASSYSTRGASAYASPTPVKPRASLSVDFVAKVLTLGDMYRNLDGGVQRTCVAFLALEEDKADDLSEIVYALLTTEEKQMVALTELVRLRHEEPVNRAFSLIALSDEKLIPINDLTQMFCENFDSDKNIADKVGFCKNLERGIASIEDDIISTLEPISELLKEVLNDVED